MVLSVKCLLHPMCQCHQCSQCNRSSTNNRPPPFRRFRRLFRLQHLDRRQPNNSSTCLLLPPFKFSNHSGLNHQTIFRNNNHYHHKFRNHCNILYRSLHQLTCLPSTVNSFLPRPVCRHLSHQTFNRMHSQPINSRCRPTLFPPL